MATKSNFGVYVVLLLTTLGSDVCKGNVIISHETNPNHYEVLEQLQNVAGEMVTNAISTRISQHLKHLSSPNFPLLPLLPGYPFPEEIRNDPITYEWTLLDTAAFKMDLSINFTTDMVTSGLNTLVDFITFRTMPSGTVEVFWKLDFPTLSLLADYDLLLKVADKADEPKSLTFHISSTNAALTSQNYSISLFAEARAFPLYEKLTLTQLNVNTQFPEISWNANWLIETILGNGTTTTLIDEVGDIGEALGAILKGISDTLSKVQLQCFINYVINDCAVSDLVNEKYSCLKTDIENADCFNDPTNPPEPTTGNPTDNTDTPPTGPTTTGPTTTGPTTTGPTTTTTGPTTTGPTTTGPTTTTTTTGPTTTGPTTTGPTTTGPTTTGPTTTGPTTTTTTTGPTTNGPTTTGPTTTTTGPTTTGPTDGTPPPTTPTERTTTPRTTTTPTTETTPTDPITTRTTPTTTPTTTTTVAGASAITGLTPTLLFSFLALYKLFQ